MTETEALVLIAETLVWFKNATIGIACVYVVLTLVAGFLRLTE